MAITIQWIGHASFRIDCGTIIYIDPWKLATSPKDADILLISHDHFDHYIPEDVDKVVKDDTRLIASADVVARHGSGESLSPGQSASVGAIKITATTAYNINKDFHPRENDWLGFILEIDGKRIYFVGDSDDIPEFADVKNIDLALIPIGGTYTMTAAEAAAALKKFNPKQAVPYHWGDIVGSGSDAETFAQNAPCPVTILQPGESLSL